MGINFIPAYCEDLHSRILAKFHEYRRENNLPEDVIIDGCILNTIIGKAKIEMYKSRPDAEKAGWR